MFVTVATVSKVKNIASAPRSPRICGIGVAAKQLGCTRQHLLLVIQGERSSPELLARYRSFSSKISTQKN
jgi:peptide deformylase